MTKYCRMLLIVLATMAVALPLFSQATAVVQIVGVVTDPQGLAIPAAEVKATQTDTGFVRTTTTGTDGHYILASLPVGPYRLEVTSEGFMSHVQRGIVLQVNTNPVINVALEIGAVSQQIEVTAGATMTETQEMSVSEVIDNTRILDMPLNGRQVTELVLLSGAAVVPPSRGIKSSKNHPSSQVISVAGGQSIGTYYMLDGGDHNDTFGAINLPMPFPDALQEFSVQTSTTSVNYGVRGGATVNTVTKSGTNEFHGSAFEFFRTGSANARNFFGTDRDHLQRNQFGGVLGGPIVKNKLLFFGGYQGTRVTTAPPTTRSYVPNAAMLAGDFSSRESAGCWGGTARTLIDPTTHAPFPNNTIPTSRFSPQALNFLDYVPATSDPCGEIVYGIPNDSQEDQYIGRVDYMRSERQQVFGRYYFNDNSNPGVFDGKNLLQTTRPGVNVRVQSATFGDTFSIDPQSINAIHFTWTRGWLTRGPAPNVISAEDIGITEIAHSEGNFPALTVTGGFNTFCGTCSKAYVHNQTYQFADDVNLVRGRHQVAFGINAMQYRSDYQTSTQQNAAFSFNSQFTNDGLADFMLGIPSLFQQGNLTKTDQVQNIWGLYVQDKMRVTPRLTLNAGVRWEPFLPVYDRQDRRTHFDMDAFLRGEKSGVFENAPAGLFFPDDPGIPRAGTHSDWLKFSPRLGLAWDPRGDGKLTVRASYGIMFDQMNTQYVDRFGFGSPWASVISINDPTGGFGNPYADYPGGNPFPSPSPPPADAVFPLGAQFIDLPLSIQVPYQQQWNLSVQKQIGANWLLSATYLGSKSTHRWVNKQLDPAVYIPGTCDGSPCSTTGNTQARRVLSLANPEEGAKISSMVHADDGANASYHGLLLSVNHRFSSNFTLMTNYTWSHCLSELDFNSELTGGYQDPNNRAAEKSNCDADRRQIFNSSLVVVTPKVGNNAMRRIVGGWQVSGIVRWDSGEWIAPSAGLDNARNGLSNRPDLVAGLDLDDRTLNKWFNTDALKANAIGTIGNAGRNIIVGPSAFLLDTALLRRFPLGERRAIEARVEAFNVLNHTRLGNPSTNIRSSTYGQIRSADDPRIMQFAVKFHF
jgi:Carboxypeptidase regulatory-like domain/TonB dependent receptor-like, beta-barrel